MTQHTRRLTPALFTLCLLLSGLFASHAALAVDATFSRETQILNIPALSIPGGNINLTMQRETNGCLRILTPSALSNTPFTGATYNRDTRTAVIPVVITGNIRYRVTFGFIDGCFKFTNITNLNTSPGSDTDALCRSYTANDTQVFTETTMVNGTQTATKSITETVTRSDGGTVVIRRAESAQGAPNGNVTTNSFDVSSGAQVFLGSFIQTNGNPALITRQTNRATFCPFAAVGTVANLDLLVSGSTVPVGSTSVKVTAIVPDIVISTPVGDITTTRIDTDVTEVINGVTRTAQVSSFHADTLGIVQMITTTQSQGNTTVKVETIESGISN